MSKVVEIDGFTIHITTADERLKPRVCGIKSPWGEFDHLPPHVRAEVELVLQNEVMVWEQRQTDRRHMAPSHDPDTW